MPEPEAAGDPSMEDILASIRRILNDGDGETGTPPQDAALAGTGEPHAAPTRYGTSDPPLGGIEEIPAHAADGVFLLDQTMLIEEPAPMPAEVPPPSITPAAPQSDRSYAPPRDEPVESAAAPHDYSHLDAGEPPAEPLLAPGVAAATTASLGALVRVVNQRQTPVYRGGPTLEDMVRDEIRPLVKAWLDENLAPMVERMVRTEIDRVTNRS